MKTLRLFLLAFILLSACVMRGGRSFDGLSAGHANDAQYLAGRVADELRERYAPAQTALSLDPAPGAFGEELERRLRQDGFAVGPSGLNVRYKLDVVDGNAAPGLGYVQVSCSDGQIFSVSHPLGAPAPITEPPSTRPVPEEHPIESRPLPETPPAPAPLPAPAPASVAASAPAKETPAASTPEKKAEAPASAATPAAQASPAPLEPVTVGKGLFVPVKSRAKASVVARRNNIPVADFCRWNEVKPNTMLTAGTMVFLVEPHRPDPSPSVPVAAAPPASPALQKPTPEQTSPRLSLPASPPEPSPMPAAAPAAPAVPAAYAVEEPLPLAEPVDFTPEQQWEIQKGRLLRSQMEGWAAIAGYSLIWNAQHDYEMRSNAMFTGSFLDAVRAFYAALQANGLALRVTIYEGNKVMEVSEH